MVIEKLGIQQRYQRGKKGEGEMLKEEKHWHGSQCTVFISRENVEL